MPRGGLAESLLAELTNFEIVYVRWVRATSSDDAGPEAVFLDAFDSDLRATVTAAAKFLSDRGLPVSDGERDQWKIRIARNFVALVRQLDEQHPGWSWPDVLARKDADGRRHSLRRIARQFADLWCRTRIMERTHVN